MASSDKCSGGVYGIWLDDDNDDYGVEEEEWEEG